MLGRLKRLVELKAKVAAASPRKRTSSTAAWASLSG